MPRFALQIAKSTKWNPELGKYSCGLPYKEGREEAAKVLNLVDSRKTAVRRIESLKRSLERIPEKKAKGFSEMQKFLDKGRAI